MSNYIFRHDPEGRRVYVAGDSPGYFYVNGKTQPVNEVQKIFPLPQFPAVILGTGLGGMTRRACEALTSIGASSAVDDILDLAVALPTVLGRLTEETFRRRGERRDWRQTAAYTATVIGWSARESRFVLMQAACENEYRVTEAGARWAAECALPYPPLGKGQIGLRNIYDRMVGLPPEEQIFAVLREQRRFYDAAGGRFMPGGTVTLWTLEPERIASREFWTFPDAERMRLEARELRARYESGDPTLVVDFSPRQWADALEVNAKYQAVAEQRGQASAPAAADGDGNRRQRRAAAKRMAQARR